MIDYDMVAIRKNVPTRMTVDEFLSWDSGDSSGRLWQLVDGEPMAMSPASENHGALIGEIGGLIRDHLRAKRPDCRLITTPGIVPRLSSYRNFRIPDLGVTCSPPSGEIIVPNPVLLVEVMSPSNESETWRNLWAYTTIPTVKEILVVRSTRVEAELLRRLPDGNWPAGPDLFRPGSEVEMTSIGMSVLLDAFYATSSLRTDTSRP